MDPKISHVNRTTSTPALRQAGIAINTKNTGCIIFKWDSFNVKLHKVSKSLRIVSAVITLLEQNDTKLLLLQFLCLVYVPLLPSEPR